MKQAIRTTDAPTPIGPYSQAVRAGDFVFVAGQGCTNPKSGQRADESVETETRQVLENVRAILAAAGASMSDVVKTTCYLADIGEFQRFNAVYAEYFPSDPPARTTIQAGKLPGNLRVEIEAVAFVGGPAPASQPQGLAGQVTHSATPGWTPPVR
jgi:2-iminobutanoate/2-iminopropanoate deaminase